MMSMKPVADQGRLFEVARRLIWWQTPEQSVADPVRLVAQVMALGTWDDIQTVRKLMGSQVFSEVLEQAPAGIFNDRRWNYWHIKLDRLPVPPLPKRA